MHSRNHQLANLFQAMATLLAARRANPYRVRAYRKAAEVLLSLEKDIGSLKRREELERIPGIGRDLSAKILEFLETGTVRAYEELKSPLPEEVASWTRLPGLSEPIVNYLYFRLGIRTVTDLETLVRSHLLRTVPGFTGAEQALLDALSTHLHSDKAAPAARDSTPAPET